MDISVVHLFIEWFVCYKAKPCSVCIDHILRKWYIANEQVTQNVAINNSAAYYMKLSSKS